MKLPSLRAGVAALIPAGVLFVAPTVAQTVAYVDLVDDSTPAGNVTTLNSVNDYADTGYSENAPDVQSVALMDFVTGEATGWTLQVNSTSMRYRTKGTISSETKDRGVAVTGGDAYDLFSPAFGVSGQERWDGVMLVQEVSGAREVEFVFTGLSASATYDIAFLHNYRTGTSLDKYATATLVNADGTVGSSTTYAPTSLNDEGPMLSFSDIVAGADGSFSITIAASEFYIQGLALTQVSAVPEPAETAAILGVLGLGFVFWRRRRTASSTAC